MKIKETLAKIILKTGGFVLDELSSSKKVLAYSLIISGGISCLLVNVDPPNKKHALVPQQPVIENSSTNIIAF